LRGVATADTSDVERCRSIHSDRERLACYDRALPPLQTPVATTNTGVNPSVNRFGLSAAQQRAADPAAHRDDVDRLDATVRELRRLSTGAFVLTLDNGQQWQQSEVNSRIWPEKGDRVSIRRGMLGSFLLITPANVATRVRRLK
jgi:hypothetical protein